MREKTKYEFGFGVSPQEVDMMIKSYLSEKNFQLKQENGCYYFERKATMYKGFLEYYIEQNKVTVYVYINSYKKPWPLDDSFVGSMPKSAYSNDLAPLLNRLSGLSQNQGQMMNQGQMQYQSQMMNQGQMQYQNQAKSNNIYMDTSEKRNSKFAVMAFVFSILSIFIVLANKYIAGLLMLSYGYMGYMGLKSKKRGFSIAAFIIMGIAIVIAIIKSIV